MGLKTIPAPSRLIDNEEIPLVNDTSVPSVYADGIADVEIHGDIVRITYFEYRGAGTDRARYPVLEMIRPMASCQTGVIGAMVARKLGKPGGGKAH
jgi:hypothetical protein